MPRKKNSRCGITSSQRSETPLTGGSAWPCTEIGMRRGGVAGVGLISDAMAEAAYAHYACFGPPCCTNASEKQKSSGRPCAINAGLAAWII